MKINDLKSFEYICIKPTLLKNNKIISFQYPFFPMSLVKVSIKYD